MGEDTNAMVRIEHKLDTLIADFRLLHGAVLGLRARVAELESVPPPMTTSNGEAEE